MMPKHITRQQHGAVGTQSHTEDIIVAMAKNDLYVFSVHDGTKELKPILSHPTVEGFIEVAIVGVAKKGYEVDLWYSVNTTLKAMEVSMDGITEITLQQWHNGSIVEHMAPLNEVDSSILKYLMISHGSFIEKWNVDKKKLFQSCNCYEFGSELYTENCKYKHFLLCNFMEAQ